MTEVALIAKDGPSWRDAMAYARQCPWRAGPYLAKEMEKGGWLAWERVIVAREAGCIVGFCSFRAQDELPEIWGFSPFIGFVYVEEGQRGRRISQRMIDAVMRHAAACGFERVYLMSSERGLYEKYGFEKIGDYETVWGTVDQLFARPCEKQRI